MTVFLTSQSHIVVVDPRPHNYHELAALASHNGWHIHLLTNASATMRLARSTHVALWMINVRLPDMSGFDLLEMIRDQLADARVRRGRLLQRGARSPGLPIRRVLCLQKRRRCIGLPCAIGRASRSKHDSAPSTFAARPPPPPDSARSKNFPVTLSQQQKFRPKPQPIGNDHLIRNLLMLTRSRPLLIATLSVYLPC